MKTKHNFLSFFSLSMAIPQRQQGSFHTLLKGVKIFAQKNLICKNLALFFMCLFPILGFAREDNWVPPFANENSLLYTELHTGYYYTEKNYMELFRAQHLREVLGLTPESDLPFFHYMNLDFSLGYSPFDWLSMEGFLSGFWFAQSGDGAQLFYSGPQVKRAGGAFRVQPKLGKYFGLIPEFSISFPFYKINPKFTQQPVTDDGSVHVFPSVWFYGVISDIVYIFVQGGFQWRSESLSSLAHWKGGVMLRTAPAELGFYSYGSWSVIRDKSSFRLGDRSKLLKKTNAGSLKFFSSNPGLIGFRGWLGWNFLDIVILRLSGEKDINGTHHAQGYTFLASLIVNWASKKERVDDIFQDSKDFEPNVMEEIQEAENIFENTEKDALIEQTIEKDLEEAEKHEESKIMEGTESEE